MPAQSSLVPSSESTIINGHISQMPNWEIKEEIVISGIAGRFPEADSVAELRDNLYNKVDMVTEDDRRWEPGLHGLPSRMGKIKDLSKFDAQFFGVHAKQADLLDPQGRMILEVTYEAIVDAGYHPDELRGTKTGFFVGCSSSESEELFTKNIKAINGYGITGCCRAMFSNRASYTFDFDGPSVTVDTACSSCATAFYQAVVAIRTNQCEAAIVGGCNICLRPGTSVQFYRLNMLSSDGICRSFDANGSGYVRSETVAAILLQKVSKARRHYATVVHAKANVDGFKEQGVTFPSGKMQQKLIEEIYSEANVDPLEVSFIEAHGTGTKVGDPQELSAVANVFCRGRKEPLPIGSVKSNMGHAESSSGASSIIKVILAMEKGMIPPNLHFNEPNSEIPALMNNQLQVVSECLPWNGGYACINSFGFGGANVHILLKSNPKPPALETDAPKLPQLTMYSGRTEEGVNYSLDYIEKSNPSRDFICLLHNSAYTDPTLMPYRGYALLNPGKETIREVMEVSPQKRPVWFIFSGMGTQWPGMACDLMKLPVFAKSIQRSAEVLKPFGVDLIKTITDKESKPNGGRAIIPAFVSIAAVQVALVDVLRAIDITPDGIVGHSVGELGCAYADGCLSAEEMVLSAYWRGKSVEEANLVYGSMAAVGCTWEEAKKLCPVNVYPACHNSADSVTISGPQNMLTSFIEELKGHGLFTREVDSCGYAFHSQHIFPAAPRLKAALEKIIKNPKRRTPRWVSSSVPEERWNEPISQMADAAYLVNNLVSPVLFREALQHIPENAITIEIAPHHLLQAILKRGLNPDCTFLGMMRRKVDNLEHLFTVIGKMYSNGMNPKVDKLFPPITYPVSRGTPMISPLIQWNHSDTWNVAKWGGIASLSADTIVEIDVSSENAPDWFLTGHCIDGRVLFPATGYMVLAWKAFAQSKGQDHEQMPIFMENINIHRATILSKSGTTRFMVSVMSGSGEFEICESGSIAASGQIRLLDGPLFTPEELKKEQHCVNNSAIKLDSNDIYKELRLRGYEYGPTFQGVVESNIEGSCGKLKWTDEWIVFLDTMLQFSILGINYRTLCLPTRLTSLKIDPTYHKNIVEMSEEVPIYHDTCMKKCTAGGVEMKGLKASIAPRKHIQQSPILEKYHFVPNTEENVLSTEEHNNLEEYIQVCSAVARRILEAAGKSKAQISDVMNGFNEADESVLESYLQSTNDHHILLKILREIDNQSSNSTFQENVRNIVKQHIGELGKDVLATALLNEKSLRTSVDIAIENLLSRKVKILEINSDSVPLTSWVLDLLTHYHVLLQANSIIAHPSPDSLPEDILSSSAIKTIQWNPTLKPTGDLENLDIVISKNLPGSKSELKSNIKSLTSFLKEGGFLLLLQRTSLTPAEKFLSVVADIKLVSQTEEDMVPAFEEAGLSVVCKKTSSLATLYLLRKSSDTLLPENQTVIKVVDEEYGLWVEQLKETLETYQKKPVGHNIWLVADDISTNGVVGLVTCLRQESGGDRIRCVFNNSTKKVLPEPFTFAHTLNKELLHKNLVMNVYKDGKWGTFRHQSLSSVDKVVTESEHAYINVLTRGDLSSLRWVDAPLKYWKPQQAEGRTLCQVYYAPLNFRDIMLASGKLPPDAIPGDLAMQDCILGLEFSGRDSNGKRVMGLVSSKGLATTVLVDPDFLWEVPSHWTLEQASTVPVAYSTAYYALMIRGGLRKGEKVLIHSGSGGVGQAAISIALSMSCEVYTTVGSKEKKEFLKKRFPQLTDRNFSNSRDLSFEHDILHATNGQGVDLVLNSLAEEKLQASIRCLAQHGRFLEIGKYDLSNNTPLGMSVFLKNITFHGVLLDALFESGSFCVAAKHEVVKLVDEGIKSGAVKPLPSTVYSHEQVEDAFRFMASGRHMGKVVLKIRNEESSKKVVPKPVKVSALSRTSCHPGKSYIITGGLGGFGLELAQWLIDRGAKHIVLTSRSGPRTGYQHLCLNRWRQQGVNVSVAKQNAAVHKDTVKLLKDSAAMAPVGGIFNLAVVLKDALIENQTVDNYEIVSEPKVRGTKYLDKLSSELCPSLDWFVCFSSVSCGRGNAGQTNYGYSNSVMERICEKRRKQGLPGLAIQWGAVGDVGLIQETMKGNDIVVGGTIPQRIVCCLDTLDYFLQQENTVVSSFVRAEQKERDDKGQKHSILATVAHIFGIKNPATMNPKLTLGELGLDSLMGVEIKQFLERDYDMVLSIQDIRQMTVKSLQEMDCETKQDGNGNKSSGNGSDNSVVPVEIHSLMPKKTVINLNSVREGVPVFFIHPVEGLATIFATVGGLLNCPAYGFQCTLEVPTKSMEDTAVYYLKLIPNIHPSSSIHVAGYSFGASIAFEMALQAQQNPNEYPQVQSLILLDGSPATVTTYARGHESKYLVDSQTEGEADALCTFLYQFLSVDMSGMKKELFQLPSFEARLDMVANTLIERFDAKLEKEDVMKAAEYFYKKLVMSFNYQPLHKLKRDVTLVKAANTIDVALKLSEYYDTEKVCDGKITVHVVEGSHTTFLEGKGAKHIASIITEESNHWKST